MATAAAPPPDFTLSGGSDTKDDNQSNDVPSEEGYGEIEAAAIAINYVLGVGVLGLPHAVYQAGLHLSILVLILVGCVTYLTSSWILQAMYRANVYAKNVDVLHINRYNARAHDIKQVSGLRNLLANTADEADELAEQQATRGSTNNHATYDPTYNTTTGTTTNMPSSLVNLEVDGPITSPIPVYNDVQSVSGSMAYAPSLAPSHTSTATSSSSTSSAIVRRKKSETDPQSEAAEAYICIAPLLSPKLSPELAHRHTPSSSTKRLTSLSIESVAVNKVGNNHGNNGNIINTTKIDDTPNKQPSQLCSLDVTVDPSAPPLPSPSLLTGRVVGSAPAPSSSSYSSSTTTNKTHAFPSQPHTSSTSSLLSTSPSQSVPPKTPTKYQSTSEEPPTQRVILSPIPCTDTFDRVASELGDNPTNNNLIISSSSVRPSQSPPPLPRNSPEVAEPSALRRLSSLLRSYLPTFASSSPTYSPSSSHRPTCARGYSYPSASPYVSSASSSLLLPATKGPQPITDLSLDAQAEVSEEYDDEAESSESLSSVTSRHGSSGSTRNLGDSKGQAIHKTTNAGGGGGGVRNGRGKSDRPSPSPVSSVAPAVAELVPLLKRSSSHPEIPTSDTTSSSSSKEGKYQSLADLIPLSVRQGSSDVQALSLSTTHHGTGSRDDPSLGLTQPPHSPLHSSGQPGDDAHVVGLVAQYEVVQLCKTFLGTKYMVAYQLALCFLMVTSMWAYTTVFASSLVALAERWFPAEVPFNDWYMSDELGLFNIRWLIGVIAFASIVVPLALVDTQDQIGIQKALAILRFVAIGLMIVSCMWAGHANYRDSGLRVANDASIKAYYHSKYASSHYNDLRQSAVQSPPPHMSTTSLLSTHPTAKLSGSSTPPSSSYTLLKSASLPSLSTSSYTSNNPSDASHWILPSSADNIAASPFDDITLQPYDTPTSSQQLLTPTTSSSPSSASAPLARSHTKSRAKDFNDTLIPSASPIISTLPLDVPSKLTPPPDQLARMSADAIRFYFPYLLPLPSHFAQIGIIITTAVFAMLFQHSVPGIVHPLRTKRHAMRVLAATVMVTVCLYIAFASLAAAYFGSKALPSINLNWDPQEFHWKPSSPSSVYLPKPKQLNYLSTSPSPSTAIGTTLPTSTQFISSLHTTPPAVSSPSQYSSPTPRLANRDSTTPDGFVEVRRKDALLKSKKHKESHSQGPFDFILPSSSSSSRKSFTYRFFSALLQHFLSFISFIIFIFPPVDVVSVFPLIAITLGNSLTATAPAWLTSRVTPHQLKTGCRLVACTPPLILALLHRQLSLILELGGFVGLIVAIVTPALLQLRSFRWHNKYRAKAIHELQLEESGAVAPFAPKNEPILGMDVKPNPVSSLSSYQQDTAVSETRSLLGSETHSTSRSSGRGSSHHNKLLIRLSTRSDTPFGNPYSSTKYVVLVLLLAIITAVSAGLAMTRHAHRSTDAATLG